MVAAGRGCWRTRQQRKQKILYWFVKTSFAPLPSPPRPRPRRSRGEVRGSGCVVLVCCYVHIVSDSGLTATTKNDQSEHFADHNCLIDTFKLWVMQTTGKIFLKIKKYPSRAIRLDHESILLCPNLMILIGNESKYAFSMDPTSSSLIPAVHPHHTRTRENEN